MNRFTLAAVLLLLASSERDAFAFCRSTACKCPSNDKAADEVGPGGMPLTECSLPTGACPRDEHGCRTTGKPLSWAGKCIGWSASLVGTSQLADEEWTRAFEESFDAWQFADCGGGEHPSISLYALRPTLCAVSEYQPDGPNINTIYFTDNGFPGPQTSQVLDSVLARTKSNFNQSGELYDADIAINSARHDFSIRDQPRPGDQDLVSVLTHEVGHFLGLDHSDVEGSVMYWSYSDGTKRRKLSQDDIDAICTSYPPGRQASCDPHPRGGLVDTCEPKPEVNVAGCTATHRNDGSLLAVGAALLGFTAIRLKARRGKQQ